jgi:ABC-type transporter Mla MlaB component
MLRVTRFQSDESIDGLRVEGRLTHLDLPRFHEACSDLLESGCRLRLDLSGLQFADRDAVAALRALRHRGVSLVGASGFLDALLADSLS